MKKPSYQSTLNEILKTDKVITQTDETLITIKGQIRTIWNRISQHKFERVESGRVGVELSN